MEPRQVYLVFAVAGYFLASLYTSVVNFLHHLGINGNRCFSHIFKFGYGGHGRSRGLVPCVYSNLYSLVEFSIYFV